MDNIKGLAAGDVEILIDETSLYGDWQSPSTPGSLLFSRAVTPDGKPKKARFAHIAIPSQKRVSRSRLIRAEAKYLEREYPKTQAVDGDISVMTNYLYLTTDMERPECVSIAKTISERIGSVKMF